jgi:hypothetical protein
MEKKRGRPKKPKRELRSKPLRILLNPSERQSIDAAARGESMETSTWARMVLLSAANGDGKTARPAVKPDGRAGG